MTIGTEHRYIVRDDDILSGEPIVVGTRVPVRAVVGALAPRCGP